MARRDIQHEPGGRRLRRLRAHAAARRARRAVPGRRRAPPGLRAVHRARPARGLDPRVRRATSSRCAAPRGEGRGRSLLDRLRARRERAREVNAEIAGRRGRAPGGDRAPRRRPASASAEPERRPPEPVARGAAAPAPRARGADERRPEDGARAGASSTRSDHTRTVGGVARSLGAPGSACARSPSARASSRSRSMWELSWYRYEVDLSDEAGGVRRDAQGDELVRALAPRSGSPTPPPTSAAGCTSRRLSRVTRRMVECRSGGRPYG